MLAVDTNVVLRVLLNDDAAQAEIARRLVESHEIWLPLTVLLETEWVLRSAAGLASERIHRVLTSFIHLPQVAVEAPEQVVRALHWFEQGMDFADALHLSGAEHCSEFATFDRKLAIAAKKASASKIKVL